MRPGTFPTFESNLRDWYVEYWWKNVRLVVRRNLGVGGLVVDARWVQLSDKFLRACANFAAAGFMVRGGRGIQSKSKRVGRASGDTIRAEQVSVVYCYYQFEASAKLHPLSIIFLSLHA